MRVSDLDHFSRMDDKNLTYADESGVDSLGSASAASNATIRRTSEIEPTFLSKVKGACAFVLLLSKFTILVNTIFRSDGAQIDCKVVVYYFRYVIFFKPVTTSDGTSKDFFEIPKYYSLPKNHWLGCGSFGTAM